MTLDKNEIDWSKIKRTRQLVNMANLAVVPWFLIGIAISSQTGFLVFWIFLFLVISKYLMYKKINALKCPLCGGRFLDNGFSVAFAKNCSNCKAKVE